MPPFAFSTLLAALALLPLSCSALAQAADDPLTRPIASPYAEQWNRPQQPVRIHGDTYYVGVGGLSVVLIHTQAGLILIDGALPQSVAAIKEHIGELGFRLEDIKFILNTEAHFDHSGGIAALARDSGAQVVASPWAPKPCAPAGCWTRTRKPVKSIPCRRWRTCARSPMARPCSWAN